MPGQEAESEPEQVPAQCQGSENPAQSVVWDWKVTSGSKLPAPGLGGNITSE